MLQPCAVLPLEKYIEAVPRNLHDECGRFLSEHERHGGEGHVEALSPHPFLFVVDDELAAFFELTGVEVKEDAVVAVVFW